MNSESLSAKKSCSRRHSIYLFYFIFFREIRPGILCPADDSHEISKKGKRKVQGVPQSQTAALHRPQEEEETDKSKQAQIEQTYEKH